MLNTIKADLIKLKGFFLFKLISFFIIIIFSGLYIALYIHAGNYEQYTGINLVGELLRNEGMIFIFMNTILLVIFSGLIDSIFIIDKNKNTILYTKNIRAKYFWSKYLISLVLIILIMISINLIISIGLFIIFSLPKDIFMLILTELMFKSLLFFLIIIPTLLFFSFLNIIGIKGLIFGIFILVFFIFNLTFGNNLSKYNFYKYIEEYSILGNYNSYLKSIYSNDGFYINNVFNDKYINNDFKLKYSEVNLKIQKFNPFYMLLGSNYTKEAGARDMFTRTMLEDSIKYHTTYIPSNNIGINYIEKKEEFKKHGYDLYYLIETLKNGEELNIKYLNKKIKVNFYDNYNIAVYILNGKKYYTNNLLEKIKNFNFDKTLNNNYLMLPESILLLFNKQFFNLNDYDLKTLNDLENNISLINKKYKTELMQLNGKNEKEKLIKLYESLGGYENYMIDLKWKRDKLYNNINVKYKLLYPNYKKVLGYFIGFNNRFYNLVLFFIIIGTLSTIIMKRRQVYN